MASQEEEDQASRNETKYMWIAVGIIVVIILGGMGINMLVHHETNAEGVEIKQQSSSPQQ